MRDQTAVVGDSNDMFPGILIPVLSSLGESGDDFQSRLVQLSGPVKNALLQLLVANIQFVQTGFKT